MTEKLKLMCVLAHPDDESLGTGGILARYSAEGVETTLITATRGEQGWTGDKAAYPGPQALGQIREAELRAAAKELGIREASFLDYIDGELDRANLNEAIGKIVAQFRRIRPQVVVTFDPYGVYGHPDHIAICQFTTAAIVAAASSDYPDALPPHCVAKLYYMVERQEIMREYQAIFGDLIMEIDNMKRHSVAWDDWAITTRIDTSDYWRQVWKAISCHRSQLPEYQSLINLPEEQHRKLWGHQTFYRAFSLVNSGREVETDLFMGLRHTDSHETP